MAPQPRSCLLYWGTYSFIVWQIFIKNHSILGTLQE